MCHAVYKYPLALTHPDYQADWHTELPIGAKVLRIDHQGGGPVAWCEISLEHKDTLELRAFKIFGTGWTWSEEMGNLGYVNTFFNTYGGMEFVWHCYEVFDL